MQRKRKIVQTRTDPDAHYNMLTGWVNSESNNFCIFEKLFNLFEHTAEMQLSDMLTAQPVNQF